MTDQYGVQRDIIGWNITRTDGDLNTETLARIPDCLPDSLARARRIALLLSLYGLTDEPARLEGTI